MGSKHVAAIDQQAIAIVAAAHLGREPGPMLCRGRLVKYDATGKPYVSVRGNLAVAELLRLVAEAKRARDGCRWWIERRSQSG